MGEDSPPEAMPQLRELRRHDTFRFSCHPRMSCFNACCRNLNQFLTPYDIVRLKENLGLTSERFLKTYTQHHTGPRSGLPVVTLKTDHKEGLPCPFVTPRGCMVYEDRPGSCRIYPLGRIARRRPDERGGGESYFLINEAHCLGHGKSRHWTVEAWKKDQGLGIYNEMNDLVMELLVLKGQRGRRRLTPAENDLLYMGFYDLDRFRDFAFEKNLWQGDANPEGVREAILEDDVALLRFAIEWIKGELFDGRGTGF